MHSAPALHHSSRLIVVRVLQSAVETTMGRLRALQLLQVLLLAAGTTSKIHHLALLVSFCSFFVPFNWFLSRVYRLLSIFFS